MSGDGLMTALGAVTNVLFVLGAVYIYLSLVRQIAARAEAGDDRHFGVPEVILAALMATLFALNAVLGSSDHGSVTLTTRDLFLNALISLSLLLFIYGFLTIRRIPVAALTGFAKLGFWRTLVTAIVLLLAAYPLIFVADQITQRLLGEPTSRQTIVELFSGSHTLEQRVIIIILAVAIAPLFEEYFFRFLLYSVIKRYFGRSAGLVANALLFALVHAHLPSAGPLFVLGACFTVAFEWSGSILVPMTMHALFNSLTLTALAFPELVPQ